MSNVYVYEQTSKRRGEHVYIYILHTRKDIDIYDMYAYYIDIHIFMHIILHIYI